METNGRTDGHKRKRSVINTYLYACAIYTIEITTT